MKNFTVVKIGFYLNDMPEKNAPMAVETFSTKEEAIEYINKRDQEPYWLDYGEQGRPFFVILHEEDWERFLDRDLGDYDWDENSCSCGSCLECRKFMVKEDREWAITHSLSRREG